MTTGGERFHDAVAVLRRARGDAPAIVDAGARRSVTRDALAALIDRSGAAIGDGPEARPVALCLPSSPELVAAVLACWRARRVPLLIDAELAESEARAIAARLGLDRMLTGPALEWRPVEEVAAVAPVLPPDTAVLKVTSGTTGEPFAVAVTGDALAAGVAQIATTMRIEASDRTLAPVSLTHSYGFDSAIVTLATLGCPIVLARGLPPSQLLAAGREAGATVLLGVPILLDVLSRSSSGGAWPELRLVVSAGAPLGVATRERFTERYGIRPRTFYGSTECGGITFDREGAAGAPEGSVGAPLDGVAVEMDRATVELDQLALDEGVGRVRVRSASVAAGYLPEPSDDAGRAVIGDGWFLTADLGRLDERGRLHLLGRVDDAINVGGRKVFPAEVERVIRAVEGVREVAVVAIERAAGAAALAAIVAAEPGLDRTRVLAACEARLARHKVPRTIELCPELPRTSRGKLDRRGVAAVLRGSGLG